MRLIAPMLLAVLLLGTASAEAQEGGVRGRVIDWYRHGTVVGAVVTLHGHSGSYETISGKDGFFVFLGLLPGMYSLVAEKPGYFGTGCSPLFTVEPDEVRDASVGIDAIALLDHCTHSESTSLVDPDATADVYNIH